MHLPGHVSQWFEGFVKHDFTVAGRPVTVVSSESPLAGYPWAWIRKRSATQWR